MKFIVTFKNPDALFEALSSLSLEDQKEARETCRKFFKWGEYAHIEIDTEKETATVLAAE